MNRIDKSQETYKKLFGDGVPAAYATHPEFQDILSRFIFGEIFDQGALDDKQRELITLVVLTTNQTLPQLKAHVRAALNVGLTPVEIQEAIYQCAPYLGFPKTLNAISEMNEVFEEQHVALPLESQQRVEEDNRLNKGLGIQKRFLAILLRKTGKMPRQIKSIYRTTFQHFALVTSIPVEVWISKQESYLLFAY